MPFLLNYTKVRIVRQKCIEIQFISSILPTEPKPFMKSSFVYMIVEIMY